MREKLYNLCLELSGQNLPEEIRPPKWRVLLGGLFGLALLWAKQFEEPNHNVVKAEFATALVVGLILSAVSLVLSELLRPKPDFENAKPAGTGDFKFPTAVEGRVVPLVWGKVKVAGPNVVWWGNLTQVPIREKIKTGLFSSKRVTTGYRYFVGIQMAIARAGGATGLTLHRIFVGDKVLQDGGFGHNGATDIDDVNFLGGDDFGAGGMSGPVRFHDGRDDQVANAYLQTYQGGASLTPAYRGTSYVVAEDLYIGNSTTIKPWAFEVSRFPSTLFSTDTAGGVYESGHHIVNSDDANPMEVAYEVFTNGDWGFGFGSGDIDTDAFARAAETLWDEGNGFAMVLDRAAPASQLIELLSRQIDGIFYLDRVTGLVTVKLAREDYLVPTAVTSITGTDTFNIAAGGDLVSAGDTIYAEDFVDAGNNGEFTVASSTATTITVTGTLVNAGAGGTISSVKRLDSDNVIEVKDFSRQTWDGTSNQVRIGFTDRSREYFDTFAQSHDIANQRMQDNEIVSSTIQMPGVKQQALASSLAARELRFLSYPLAKATLIVTREFWDANPADVFVWSDDALNVSFLPMRVTDVDYGTDVNGRITLQLVQDVFSTEQNFFGTQDPFWTVPSQDVQEIPVDEHQVFEAPKAIIDRDPVNPGVSERVFVGARAQNAEVGIDIYRRNHPSDTSGETYVKDGEIPGMFLIGNLNVALEAGDANPTGTIQVQASPDSIARISLALDPDGASAEEIGQDLANIIKIGDEFIGFEGFTNETSTTIDLTGCYRGLMDSVPADHAVDAYVYLLFVNSGLSEAVLPIGDLVDIQPRAVSRDDEMTTAEAKTFSFQMDNRYRRPYPPHKMSIDTVRFDTSVDIDGAITNPGGDAQGLDVDWERRDWENTDEVAALLDDANDVDSGFQARHDHESQLFLDVTDDDGLVVRAQTNGWINGNADVLARGDFLWVHDGAIPSTDEITIRVQTRHTVDTVTYTSRYSLDLDATPSSSALSGLTNLGTVFANGPVSRTYTVASATIHSVTVASLTGVEFRLNNGAWTAIGSFPAGALAVNDELEFRHGDTSGSPLNAVLILDDGTSDVAYCVLHTGTEFEGLVGYWTMNESSVGSSQIDRAARFGGAPDFVDMRTCPSGTGQFSNAVQVTDGGNVDANVEYLHISDTDAIRKALYPQASEDYTITAWVRLPAGGATAKTTQTIWSMADYDSTTADTPDYVNRSTYLFYNDYPSGGFTFAHIDTAATGNVTSAAASLGGTNGVNDEETWILVSCRKNNSAGTIRIYITDGTNTAGATSGGTAGALQSTDQGIQIGASYRSGAVSADLSMEEALIDDFRIYRGRELSDSDIDALAAATHPLS